MLRLYHWHFSNFFRLPSSTKNSHLSTSNSGPTIFQSKILMRHVHGVVPVITHIFNKPTIKKLLGLQRHPTQPTTDTGKSDPTQLNPTHGWIQPMSISACDGAVRHTVREKELLGGSGITFTKFVFSCFKIH